MQVVQENLGQGEVSINIRVAQIFGPKEKRDFLGHPTQHISIFGQNLESFWVKFDDWELCLKKLVPVNLQNRKTGCSGLEMISCPRFATMTCVKAFSAWDQGLTSTRYPTLPGFYFYYSYPTRNFFENFRVQGSI